MGSKKGLKVLMSSIMSNSLVTGSVHLKILKLVETPYYLQMGANNANNKAARASVYAKGGITSNFGDGDESPRRSMRTSLGTTGADPVRDATPPTTKNTEDKAGEI